MTAHPYRQAPPVRVAVLGSCVSRDLFNSSFNPHYKDLFECVALSNQASLISLMSDPVDVPAAGLTDLNDHARREVAKEATRGFLEEVVRVRPDYLLVDLFADVHFGCFSVDGRYLTRNRWKILRTRYYASAETVDLLPTDRDTYLAVWREALDRFLGFMAAELPGTKVVLHCARNVTRVVSADGSVRPLGNEADLLAMNEWWEQLDAEVLDRGVDRVLDLFTDRLTSIDTHPWGAFAVHYTLDYHRAALSKLTQIVLSDAHDATEPSVGAALRVRAVIRRRPGALNTLRRFAAQRSVS